MATSPRSPELDEQLRRVRQEFLDTPSLRLTPWGRQRQFGLQPRQRVEILEALLAENVLCRTNDSLFVQSGSVRPGAP
jgi:hypothetical protein